MFECHDSVSELLWGYNFSQANTYAIDPAKKAITMIRKRMSSMVELTCLNGTRECLRGISAVDRFLGATGVRCIRGSMREPLAHAQVDERVYGLLV